MVGACLVVPHVGIVLAPHVVHVEIHSKFAHFAIVIDICMVLGQGVGIGALANCQVVIKHAVGKHLAYAIVDCLLFHEAIGVISPY